MAHLTSGQEKCLARSIAAGADRCLMDIPMAEWIVLSLEHLLGVTCQVQTRCHSFSNANCKNLRTTFCDTFRPRSRHPSVTSSIPTTTTFPLLQPSLRLVPPSKDFSAYGLLPSHSYLVCSFRDFLCCMIMNLTFIRPHHQRPALPVYKLECTYSQPPDSDFHCQSRICSAG
jgi:hypothetical protein